MVGFSSNADTITSEGITYYNIGKTVDVLIMGDTYTYSHDQIIAINGNSVYWAQNRNPYSYSKSDIDAGTDFELNVFTSIIPIGDVVSSLGVLKTAIKFSETAIKVSEAAEIAEAPIKQIIEAPTEKFIGETAVETIEKIHGNSLKSLRLTWVLSSFLRMVNF